MHDLLVPELIVEPPLVQREPGMKRSVIYVHFDLRHTAR